jgi:hypothetical protein
LQACKDLAVAKAKENNFEIKIEEEVFKNAVSFSACSISLMCAFFGGIVA